MHASTIAHHFSSLFLRLCSQLCPETAQHWRENRTSAHFQLCGPKLSKAEGESFAFSKHARQRVSSCGLVAWVLCHDFYRVRAYVQDSNAIPFFRGQLCIALQQHEHGEIILLYTGNTHQSTFGIASCGASKFADKSSKLLLLYMGGTMGMKPDERQVLPDPIL